MVISSNFWLRIVFYIWNPSANKSEVKNWRREKWSRHSKTEMCLPLKVLILLSPYLFKFIEDLSCARQFPSTGNRGIQPTYWLLTRSLHSGRKLIWIQPPTLDNHCDNGRKENALGALESHDSFCLERKLKASCALKVLLPGRKAGGKDVLGSEGDRLTKGIWGVVEGDSWNSSLGPYWGFDCLSNRSNLLDLILYLGDH